jgi:magnesium transporter
MSVRPLTSAQLHEPIRPYVTPVPLTLGPDMTVAAALDVVRRVKPVDGIHYFYAVDERGVLQGVVPARVLLSAEPDERVGALMRDDLIAIPHWATVLVASEYFASRRLLAFPVIEDDGRLLGVVDVSLFTNELVDLGRRTYDDIFQLIGVHATALGSPWSSYRDRLPWLLANVTGGLLCAAIASQYEHLLDVAVVLSLFIPMVLALAESVSMQSATLTLQSMTDRPVSIRTLARSLWIEGRTAVLLGASCAALVGGVAFAWRRDVTSAAVIGGAIFFAMTTACVLGVFVPTALRWLKADPRIAAGPLVLALADVCTLLFYFGLGARLLL